MDAGTRQRLGSSFGQATRAYGAHRPTYPTEAVRWLVGDVVRDVLDLGAGTGSLTAALADLGHRVIAAEPSMAMLQALASCVSAVPAVGSSAESLPFGPASFDAVTVGTAFHWFDAGQALPEVASVLRPGGRLALVWNSRTEPDGWAQEFGDLLRAVQPRQLSGDWGTGSVGSVKRSPRFRPLETADFAFVQRIDRGGLIGLAASRSYVIELAEDRRVRLFDEIGRLFDQAAEGNATLDLPYVARCWRCHAAPTAPPPSRPNTR